MDCIQLIEAIRKEFISDPVKKQNCIQAYEVCEFHTHEGIFDLLFAFLDYFAIEVSDNDLYEINIKFENNRILVYNSGNSFIAKELSDFIGGDPAIFESWVNQYSGEESEWETYMHDLELYKYSKRSGSSHFTLLRNIIKSFESIDLRVDKHICSFSHNNRGKDSLEGLIPLVTLPNGEDQYFMVLYPKDIEAMKKEFFEWSETPTSLKYLNSPNIIIKSNASLYSNRFKHIRKSNICIGKPLSDISYTKILYNYKEEYWAILDTGTTAIPRIVANNIKADSNTPSYYKHISSIGGGKVCY